jgi:hypothetical protein
VISVRVEKKDIAFLIPATLLAFAGLGPDDLLLVGSCLFLSWATFLVICIIHESSLKSRITVAIVMTLLFIGVGYRRLGPLIPPRKTESKLEYNRIDVFKKENFIASNEKLGFKIVLRNTGTLTISQTRFVIVTSMAQADNAFIPNLIGQLEQAVRTDIKDAPVVKSWDIPAGRELGQDTVITLEPDQASGLLDGTMRLYFLVWWGWKGSDGKYGSDQICMWMPQPKTSVIDDDVMRGQPWERCVTPEPIQYKPN